MPGLIDKKRIEKFNEEIKKLNGTSIEERQKGENLKKVFGKDGLLMLTCKLGYEEYDYHDIAKDIRDKYIILKLEGSAEKLKNDEEKLKKFKAFVNRTIGKGLPPKTEFFKKTSLYSTRDNCDWEFLEYDWATGFTKSILWDNPKFKDYYAEAKKNDVLKPYFRKNKILAEFCQLYESELNSWSNELIEKPWYRLSDLWSKVEFDGGMRGDVKKVIKYLKKLPDVEHSANLIQKNFGQLAELGEKLKEEARNKCNLSGQKIENYKSEIRDCRYIIADYISNINTEGDWKIPKVN